MGFLNADIKANDAKKHSQKFYIVAKSTVLSIYVDIAKITVLSIYK